MKEALCVEEWCDDVSNTICNTMTQDIYLHVMVVVFHRVEVQLRPAIMWGDLDEWINA